MKTISAIILNALCPGTGYLYLKNPDRMPYGYVLSVLFIFCYAYGLYNLLFFPESLNYPIDSSPPPFLGLVMYAFLLIDTYCVSKKPIKNK